ncbi:YihY/virulence factor BrkB family protein [Halomonas litopenaei]|uniref:acylphosphatase n=3 Tax=Halomonadaceae TaxID=28256 RepID=A0ABX5IUL4_9GAMM|nr:YihY family inner membrane protein [Gammaproteobacteria bacterium]PTL89574.1 YihY/virulence factor BrkB family protein [Halomonas sp. SYSU XM8]PTL91626.1 YihY/virulence factor BrkB family protein [Halomonas litopenaei]RQW69979.1 YihY family inner membrane protein [Halomonas sp. YLB-10]
MIIQFFAFWWGVLRRSVALWLERNAFSYAGSLAFYTLFSLAPTVIIAVTVIGVVLGEEAAQGQIFAQLQGTMGPEAATAIEHAVAQSRIQESGLLPTLLGFAALAVGATTVFGQMQFSLNTIWGVAARPSSNSLWIFVKNRMLSLTIVLAIGFILLVSVGLGVFVRAALKAADDVLPYVSLLTRGVELLVSIGVIAALFATIFKVLPDVVLRWRDVIVGAVVTALLFSIGRTGIALYLAYNATASTYGAAGSVVVVLLWVYYSSLILLFGAAFTKVHLLARHKPIIPRNSAVLVKQELLDQQSVRAQLSAEEEREFEQEARERQHEAELEAGGAETAGTVESRQANEDDEVSVDDTVQGADVAREEPMDEQQEAATMSDDTLCLEALVEGRVQGVSYRFATRQQAEAEGLAGYARNLPDGSVEVLLCGPRDAVERVADWLEYGPEQAEVTQVTTREVTLDKPPRDFTTG